MIRLLFLSISALFLAGGKGDKDRFKPIEKTFPINWKAKIGNVSFRSNVLFAGNELIIGSNGKEFRDFYLGDPTSGMYKLNRQTGKINGLYGNDQVIGDMDVNGILAYNNRYYFGNDNDEFICMDASGKYIWNIMTSGDIEHEPVMIQINGKPAIVYASETGEVRAVNPDNGQSFWSYYIPDFKGWKPGDNRAAFKIRSFVRNTMSFYTKPLVIDLNKDGILDLVFNEIYGSIYAINGSNGKVIWTIKPGEYNNYFDVIELLKKPEGDWIMIGCKSRYVGDGDETLIQTYLISLNGSLKEIGSFKDRFGSCGLNIITCSDGDILFTSNTNLYRIKNLQHTEIIDRGIKYVTDETWYTDKNRFRNTYHPLMSRNTFPYKGHSNCLFILNQYDEANINYGSIEIFSMDENKTIEVFELPGNSEMEPLVQDINKDGKLDVLINDRTNGYLYCYNLDIPVSSTTNK